MSKLIDTVGKRLVTKSIDTLDFEDITKTYKIIINATNDENAVAVSHLIETKVCINLL